METPFGEVDVDAREVGEPASVQGPGEPKPRQPSVEDIPDEGDRLQRHLAGQSLMNESLHPSRASSIPPQTSAPSSVPAPGPAPAPAAQSPAAPTTAQNMDMDETDPGLNLPSAPTFAAQGSVPNLPDTPAGLNMSAPPHAPNAFQSFPPPSTLPPTSPPAASYDPNQFYNQPAAPAPAPAASNFIPNAPAAAAAPVPAPVPSTAPARPNPSIDDNAISQAQKHARWAVSALTFDDVNTAIKELQESLRTLGAQ